MPDPAYRTITEVAALVGIPHHVLRFWETKFPAIAPLKRGGNRRYYRLADVAAITTVARLLHDEGYTIKGAQKLLTGSGDEASVVSPAPAIAVVPAAPPSPIVAAPVIAPAIIPTAALAVLRADLAAALAAARAL